MSADKAQERGFELGVAAVFVDAPIAEVEVWKCLGCGEYGVMGPPDDGAM